MKYLSAIVLSFCLVSCQQSFFGLDEATWTTLSEQEREKVIDGYNKRKELRLIAKQKEEEHEREKELRRQEIEAENAPLYAVADVVSTIVRGSNDETHTLRIQSIQDQPFKKKLLTVRDQVYEVSSYEKLDSWIRGQRIEIKKNDSFLYPVKIKNLENGESVLAHKLISCGKRG